MPKLLAEVVNIFLAQTYGPTGDMLDCCRERAGDYS
jgi:hypothetical protein